MEQSGIPPPRLLSNFASYFPTVFLPRLSSFYSRLEQIAFTYLFRNTLRFSVAYPHTLIDPIISFYFFTTQSTLVYCSFSAVTTVRVSLLSLRWGFFAFSVPVFRAWLHLYASTLSALSHALFLASPYFRPPGTTSRSLVIILSEHSFHPSVLTHADDPFSASSLCHSMLVFAFGVTLKCSCLVLLFIPHSNTSYFMALLLEVNPHPIDERSLYQNY